MGGLLALDLAGSPRRPTGFAYFKDNKIITGHVYSDRELEDLIEHFSIIGIDAPLSLPKGRRSLDVPDDNHYRECDLLLRKRKIKFFPITLGPMRMLTKRGISLKEKFPDKEWYELFPGASYDILGLPRKDIKALEHFLEPFSPSLNSQHEADSSIGLFTLYLHKKGFGELLKGNDGSILVPKPAIYLGPKVEATFLERINRFVVRTDKGLAYLRDTAKLSHILTKGRKLYLTPYKGKFKYMVKAAFVNKQWILLDSFLDNQMFYLYMRSQGIVLEKAEKFQNIIYDFSDGTHYYEIKGAHLFQGNIALFPDTYSKRAEKHFSQPNVEVSIVAHGRAKAVAINPKYPKLNELLKDKKVWGISTSILEHYWVFEKEIPFLRNLATNI